MTNRYSSREVAQPLTAPMPNAGGSTSICNKCRFAKDSHFLHCKCIETVIFVINIGLKDALNRTRHSCNPLAASITDLPKTF